MRPPAPRQWLALAAICAADFFVLGALAAPIAVGVARHLDAIRPAGARWTTESGLSTAFVVAALVSLGSQILFGWLGDRARSRRRGRLPFLVGGSVVGCAGLWQAGQSGSLAGVVGWFALAVLGYGATFASVFGTFADVVDSRIRSRSAGYLAAAAGAATAVPLAVHSALPVSDFTTFGLFPALAVLVSVLAAVVLAPYVGGDDLPVAEAPREAAVAGWRSQFWLLVLQRALTQFALVLGAVYSFLFLVRRVGLDAEADATSHWATGVAAGGDVLLVTASIAFGYVAARTRDSLRPMRLGLVLVAAGLASQAVATTTWHFLVAQLLIGFGSGAYLGCDLALVFRVVPAASAGRYLGFFNIARNLPQTIGPAIGPVLLAIGSGDHIGADRSQNYTAFFLVGCLAALVALVATGLLRVRSADLLPVPAPA